MSQKETVSMDPITLEVLRNRLEAILEEAEATIRRAAISPVITESGDFACAIMDADGRLLGAGHRTSGTICAASAHAVKCTIAKYGEEIVAGDVFLANDPHNGGGLHPQDVVVQQPIFVDGQRVAWVANSAHLMDVGGMTPGSFATNATECYQEAVRVPPVRLFRAGVEVTDVWDILRNNIRVSELVEMDLRGLVAGCHVADQKISGVVEATGVDVFAESLRAIRELSEREMRRRIDAIADGVYCATSWAEWNDEFYECPCQLTVDGDRLIFDFDGASPQAPHYFNSKPYIIESELVPQVLHMLAADLPFTDGIFAPFELRCPEGSILNSVPPAPVGAAHLDVATNAMGTAVQCLRLALNATPEPPAQVLVTGWIGNSALGLHTWSAVGHDGEPDAWLLLDGTGVGAPADLGRDGLDISGTYFKETAFYPLPDVEILEMWYPMLLGQKGARTGVNGAGKWQSGGGVQMAFRPHGTKRLTGEMLGMRRWLPLPGAGGGMPGATTQFLAHRIDGSIEELATHAAGVVIEANESFEFRLGSGGGVGDPLDREIADIESDLELGRITTDEAANIYGMVLVEGQANREATVARRAKMLRDRLSRAQPPKTTLEEIESARRNPDAQTLPLYPGVVHCGRIAYAEASGVPLAVAPAHWTDGCSTLEQRLEHNGPPVTLRWYLDPTTGRSLYVDVAPEGKPRTFATLPKHWIDAI